MKMRVLTLYPEWVWAIAAFGKDVENRGDGRRRHALHGGVGERVALHAGARAGGPGGLDVRHYRFETYRRTILAIVPDVALVPDSAAALFDRRRVRCIYASAVIGEPTTNSSSPWAVRGAWHYPLHDVLVHDQLVSVAHGALGLWGPIEVDLEGARPVPPGGLGVWRAA